MLSINSYWWLATNKNRLDLHIFASFLRNVLAKTTKIEKKWSGVKVIAPNNLSFRTAKWEL